MKDYFSEKKTKNFLLYENNNKYCLPLLLLFHTNSPVIPSECTSYCTPSAVVSALTVQQLVH